MDDYWESVHLMNNIMNNLLRQSTQHECQQTLQYLSSVTQFMVQTTEKLGPCGESDDLNSWCDDLSQKYDEIAEVMDSLWSQGG
jgi:hypothetical protein